MGKLRYKEPWWLTHCHQPCQLLVQWHWQRCCTWEPDKVSAWPECCWVEWHFAAWMGVDSFFSLFTCAYKVLMILFSLLSCWYQGTICTYVCNTMHLSSVLRKRLHTVKVNVLQTAGVCELWELGTVCNSDGCRKKTCKGLRSAC